MSSHPDLDLKHCVPYCVSKLFKTNSFDRGSLLSCLRRTSPEARWKRYIHSFASQYEKCEIEMLDKFVSSMLPKLLLWLNLDFGHCHRFKHRSKLWSCMNKEEFNYDTACHEAGHVVCYWFTGSRNTIKKATIVPEGKMLGKVKLEPVDPNYVFSNDALFSEMCCYMGGAVARQMHTYEWKTNLLEFLHDLIVLAFLNKKLAEGVMETIDDKGPEVKEMLMLFFLQKCYKVTSNILKEHKTELYAVSYALFAEKELDYWELHEILGPKPEIAKTLFEEFVMDDISSGQFKEIESLPKIRRKIWTSSGKECNIDFCEVLNGERESYMIQDKTSSEKESILDLSSLFKEENL